MLTRIEPAHRLPSLSAADAEAHGYVDLRERLRAAFPRDKERNTALAYLAAFARRSNPDGDGRLEALDGTREGAEAAATAWRRLVRDHAWAPRYERRVRTVLSRVLQEVVPALAVVVNPTLRRPHAQTLLATRSAENRDFTLLECLPVAVRRLHPSDPHFRLLERVGVAMAECLQSVSKAHLQKVLQFAQALLADRVVGDVPALADMSARDWLLRYREVFVRGAPHLAPDTFKNHMRTLCRLHAKVFQPGARVRVPVPFVAMRPATTAAETAESSASSSSFTASSGEEEEEDERATRREVRALMLEIRHAVVRGDDGEEKLFSFSPAEVRAIVAGAVSTVERLVVWLFLTTGLRIGGLARLRAGVGPFRTAADVPRVMATNEKNNRERRVVVGPAGRALVCRWYREDRRAADDAYLFPGAAPGRPASTRWLWSVCRAVFRRSGLLSSPPSASGHLHPHTFRHTFIHYMYMSGTSFEEIAKFIGHANASITSSVYGRLRQADIESSASCLPWVGGEHEDTKAEWRAVGRFLCNPWSFSAVELCIGTEASSPRRDDMIRETQLARKRARASS